jgi:hypothetical protein
MSIEHENYDSTPQGRETIALLQRHAPAPPDAVAESRRILQELPEPPGRILVVRWAATGVATAAAVMLALVLVLPDPQPVAPDNIADTETPEPIEHPDDLTQHPPPEHGRAMVAHMTPELAAMVRGRSGVDGWRIDAGLTHGVRTGDVFMAGDGRELTVVAVGIFDARVHCDSPLALGTRALLRTDSPALLRARHYQPAGGDPGSLFDLGAVFEQLPMHEAHDLGLNSGRALWVVETIPAILRDHTTDPEPSLAARLGLQRGDIVLDVNGHDCSDLNTLIEALQWTRHSGMLDATVIRNGLNVELRAD